MKAKSNTDHVAHTVNSSQIYATTDQEKLKKHKLRATGLMQIFCFHGNIQLFTLI